MSQTSAKYGAVPLDENTPLVRRANQRQHQGWGTRAVLVGALALGCVALAVSTVVYTSDQTRRIEDLDVRMSSSNASASLGANCDSSKNRPDGCDCDIATGLEGLIWSVTKTKSEQCASGMCKDTMPPPREDCHAYPNVPGHVVCTYVQDSVRPLCRAKKPTWEECPSTDDVECESDLCGYYSPDKKYRCCDKNYGMHRSGFKDVCNGKRSAGESCPADDGYCQSGQCFRTTRNGSYKCCGRGTFFCYPWTSGNCKSGRTYCKGYLGH